jgi:ADP-Ribosyltransferase in polyvalent proteins
MATYEEVMGALRNAHDAGDEEAAQRLAQMAQSLKGTSLSAPTKNFLPEIGFDKINAGVEALANTAAGMVGSMTTGPLAFATNLANTAFHEGRLLTPKEGGQAFNEGVDILAGPLAKRTSPLGQEYTENIGKVINELIPVAPLHGTIPAIKAGEGVNALKARFGKAADIPVPAPKPVTSLEKIKAERAAKGTAPEEANLEYLKQEALKKQQALIDAKIAQGQRPITVDTAGRASTEGVTGKLNALSPMERMAQDLGAPELNTEGFGERSGIRDMANQLIVGDELKAAREKQTGLDQQFKEREQQTREEQARYQAAQDVVNNRQNALYQNPAITHDPVTAYTAALNEKLRLAKESADSAKTQAEYVAAKEHEARIAAEVSKMERMRQIEIDDTQHVLPDTNEVIAPQYGAMKGTGRFDENGMPIRADLSMEATNLENPLQRNLWGDELGQKSPQENRSGLTQAIDKMPAGPEREAGLSLLKPPVELDVGNNPFVQALARKMEKQRELVSRLEADVQSGKKMGTQLVRAQKDLKTMQGHYEKAKANLGKVGDKSTNPFDNKSRPISNAGKYGRQRGAIDPTAFQLKFPEFIGSKIRDAAGKLKLMYHGTSKDKAFSDIKAGPRGAWFTDDPTGASEYAKQNDAQKFVYNPDKRTYEDINTSAHVHQVYLNIQKPYELSEIDLAQYHRASNYAKFQKEITEKAKREGYDGIDWGHGIYTAFDPKQIKSAISPEYKKGKQTNPFGRDTIELNSGVPLPDSIKNLFSSDKDKKPGSTLHELIPAMSRSLDTPEKVIDALKDQTDIPERGTTRKLQEATQKGLLYAKEQHNNALLNFTYNEVAKAGDAIANLKKELVDTTLLPGLRELNDKEFVHLQQVMMEGMKEKMTFTPDELQTHYGFTEKQTKLYNDFQHAFEEGYQRINATRELQNKPPISRYVGYMAGMAKGAYKRLVSIEMRKPNGEIIKDEKGNPVMTVVGIIGSDWRHITDKRMEAIKKEHPEYTFSEEKYSGPGQYGKREMSSLVEALGILSENNPSVEAFAKQMQDIMSSEAESYRGAKKHTMAKKGIWGMEGDKPKEWATPEQNALDGMKGQIEYLNKIIEWSEYSKAAEQVGKVLADPDVQLKHKNAAERSTEYLQNVLGTDPQKGLDIMVSELAKSLGMPPSFLEKAASWNKKVFNAVFLALGPMFLIANHISGAVAFPAMAQYLSSKGVRLGPDMGTGLSHIAEGIVASVDGYRGKLKTEFDKKAWQALKDFAVTDPQLMGHSTSLRKGTGYYAKEVLHTGAAGSEGMPRAAVFMGVSRLLRDAGFENDPNIFHVARDVTDMAMGVFRQEEQPTAYNQFGPLKPLASQLSTFLTNSNSNLMMLGRIGFREGNFKPIGMAILSSLLMSGVMGVPGFTQADWLFEQISSAMGKPTTLVNEILKMTRSKTGGDALSVGVPSAVTGIDMHTSFGRPNLIPPFFTGASAMAKAGTDLWNGGKDALSGDVAGGVMDAKRAAIHLSPPIARKNLEMEWFGDKKPNGNVLMHSLQKGKGTQGTMELTPTEVTARRMGFNMVSSFKKSQEDYQRNLIDQHLQDKQQKIMTSLDESLTSSKGKVNPEKVRDYLDKYIEAEGDPKTFVTQLNSKVLADNTTNVQRYLMQKANSGSLSAARALKRWKENQIVDRP